MPFSIRYVVKEIIMQKYETVKLEINIILPREYKKDIVEKEIQSILDKYGYPIRENVLIIDK